MGLLQSSFWELVTNGLSKVKYILCTHEPTQLTLIPELNHTGFSLTGTITLGKGQNRRVTDRILCVGAQTWFCFSI
ncbi:MAG: hypothetical protein PF447_00405 [Spirochaetaceae bacterium]|nr:hypothetical protein [Spirochaetaceae bacterium]